ncbi:MAG: DUF4040 domain-containing protein [Oscillospiraceae bacterium]|nr:DUF4040 domain-containing protein [Oscillospiraceae bacterium]
MTLALLLLWVVSGLLILQERTVFRMVIYLGVFSLITTIIFLFQGAPDVALANASVSGFSTIFLIVCFEKYYSAKDSAKKTKPNMPKVRLAGVCRGVAVLLFSVLMCVMFIHFLPDSEVSTYLKHQYATLFYSDVGGENAVTAIYLAYRLYDTVFEALMLVVSVIAVVHLSFFDEMSVSSGRQSEIRHSATAIRTIRVVCPIIILFGVYLIANGHLSPGGGFQGGVAVAVFFVCRFMIFNIYDLPVGTVLKDEKIVFLGIILVAVFVIFLGIHQYFPYQHTALLQTLYLLMMNTLIGVKVALGFMMLFYRYVAVDRQ